MTEMCATGTRTWPDDPSSSGTVGPPQPINEIKLLDVPAMDILRMIGPTPVGALRAWSELLQCIL